MRWSRRPAAGRHAGGHRRSRDGGAAGRRAARPRLSCELRADSTGTESCSPGRRSANQEPFLQPWQFFLLGGMLAATATVIVATGQSPANIIILSLTVVSVSFVGLGAYRILSPLVSTEVETPHHDRRPHARRARAREDAGAAIDQGARVRFRDGEDRARRTSTRCRAGFAPARSA